MSTMEIKKSDWNQLQYWISNANPNLTTSALVEESAKAHLTWQVPGVYRTEPSTTLELPLNSRGYKNQP